MKKALKYILFGLFGLFLILGVLLFVSSFYFFKYPKSVTESARDSLKIGMHITDFIKPGSDFVQAYEKNKLDFEFGLWIISEDEKKDCGKLMVNPNTLEIYDYGKLGQDGCSTIEPTFMPALFYRCTLPIVFDKDLRIKEIKKYYCWD